MRAHAAARGLLPSLHHGRPAAAPALLTQNLVLALLIAALLPACPSSEGLGGWTKTRRGAVSACRGTWRTTNAQGQRAAGLASPREMGWTVLRGGGEERAGQAGGLADGENLSMEEARRLLGERGLPASEQQVCPVALLIVYKCSVHLDHVGNTATTP